MLPIRIAFFLLKVIIKFVIEIIEVRFFIGKWVVTLQIIVITDVEVTVASLADPSLTPEGGIFAAIVLATGGDVDGAMADGMFTRADLDAARAGVADGSLEYLFD